MKIIQPLSLIASTLLLTGCIVIASPSNANRADVHFQKELSLDAASLTAFDLELGAGKANILGDEQAEEIKVIADVYMSDRDTDGYQLSLRQKGGKAVLVAETENTSGMWIGESPHINVSVVVPAHLLLDITDSSGELKVSKINNDVTINDGSGSLTVKNIKGNVTVKDGSGSTTIEQVTGDLKVDDGSGSLSIASINGTLTIDDGSGEITVNQIGGSTEIDDSSGDMTVKNVAGFVTIDDGSGDINLDGAGGFKLIDDGAGDLSVKNVKGEVNIGS